MKQQAKEFIKFIYGIFYACALMGIGISFVAILITVFIDTFKWYYLLVFAGFILITFILKLFCNFVFKRVKMHVTCYGNIG